MNKMRLIIKISVTSLSQCAPSSGSSLMVPGMISIRLQKQPELLFDLRLLSWIQTHLPLTHLRTSLLDIILRHLEVQRLDFSHTKCQVSTPKHSILQIHYHTPTRTPCLRLPSFNSTSKIPIIQIICISDLLHTHKKVTKDYQFQGPRSEGLYANLHLRIIVRKQRAERKTPIQNCISQEKFMGSS